MNAILDSPTWLESIIYLCWILFSIASIWIIGFWCWLMIRMKEPFPILICRSQGQSATRAFVVPLADHLELIPEVAAWFHREWPEASRKHDPAKRLSQFSVHNSIPMSFVALDQGRPIGTVSLLSESVQSHGHLSPWVGGLYVVPERRHQGVATQLIAEALRTAASMGKLTVYIGVSASREFYEKSGWIYEAEGYAGDDRVMIFRKTKKTHEC